MFVLFDQHFVFVLFDRHFVFVWLSLCLSDCHCVCVLLSSRRIFDQCLVVIVLCWVKLARPNIVGVPSYIRFISSSLWPIVVD